LWDMATGKELAHTRTAEDAQVLSLAFSPDGQTLVICGETGLSRWKMTGDKPRPQPFAKCAVKEEAPRCAHCASAVVQQERSIAFSPDGSVVAVLQVCWLRGTAAHRPRVSWGELLLLDAVTGQARRVCRTGEKDAPGGGLAFAPDGKTLVTADAS